MLLIVEDEVKTRRIGIGGVLFEYRILRKKSHCLVTFSFKLGDSADLQSQTKRTVIERTRVVMRKYESFPFLEI